MMKLIFLKTTTTLKSPLQLWVVVFYYAAGGVGVHEMKTSKSRYKSSEAAYVDDCEKRLT